MVSIELNLRCLPIALFKSAAMNLRLVGITYRSLIISIQQSAAIHLFQYCVCSLTASKQSRIRFAPFLQSARSVPFYGSVLSTSLWVSMHKNAQSKQQIREVLARGRNNRWCRWHEMVFWLFLSPKIWYRSTLCGQFEKEGFKWVDGQVYLINYKFCTGSMSGYSTSSAF
jgi:hypothetical protein